ncbi:unnamed protein product, partial [Rotaria sp. Silwood2]
VVFGEVVDGMNAVKIIESYDSPLGIPTAEIYIIKSGILG